MQHRVAAGMTLVMLGGCMSDKEQHFTAGLVTRSLVESQTGSPLQGCMASLGVALVKEAYDSRFGGVVDAGDVAATLGGCALTYRF